MWKAKIIKSVTTDNQKVFRLKDNVEFGFKYQDGKEIIVIGIIYDIFDDRIAVLMEDKNIHYFDYSGIIPNTSKFL